jgi:hypothetical protein
MRSKTSFVTWNRTIIGTGRLCYLVQNGDRDLQYIVTKYPHVFNSTGAIWENRLPQGDPFQLHREHSDDRPAGTEYALAFNFYLVGVYYDNIRHVCRY